MLNYFCANVFVVYLELKDEDQLSTVEFLLLELIS